MGQLTSKDNRICFLKSDNTIAQDSTKGVVSSSADDQWSEPIQFKSADELHESIRKAEKEAERRNRRYENDFVLELLLRRVPVAERTSVLTSICEMFQRDIYYSMDRALVLAIKRWRADAAVEEWCASKLPTLQNNIIALGKWVRYGHSVIHELLEFTSTQFRADRES